TGASRTETDTLSLHDALPISEYKRHLIEYPMSIGKLRIIPALVILAAGSSVGATYAQETIKGDPEAAKTKVSMCIGCHGIPGYRDRKSTRLNSSHVKISYAVF